MASTLTSNISDSNVGRGYGYGFSSYLIGIITPGVWLTEIVVQGAFEWQTVPVGAGSEGDPPVIVCGVQIGPHGYAPVNAVSADDSGDWIAWELPADTAHRDSVWPYIASGSSAYSSVSVGVNLRWRGQRNVTVESDLNFSSASLAGPSGVQFIWGGIARVTYA